MPLPYTPLPTAPSRARPTAFADEGDAFMAALPTFGTQMAAIGAQAETNASTAAADAATASAAASTASAAAVTAVNAPGTSATSTTSLTIGLGSKSLTIQTGKAFAVGQPVTIADNAAPAANWMAGNISAHTPGTGAITVNVLRTSGSGTIASWTVALAGPVTTATTLAGYGITDGVNTVATTLAASADLNTVTVSGFYTIGATPVNGPAGATNPVASGHLIVSAGGSIASQIAVGQTNGAVFVRTATGIGTSPVWTAWNAMDLYGVDVTATTATAFNGQHLKLTNVAATTVTAPASPNVGDRFRVSVMNGLTTNVINWNTLKHENLSDATTTLDDKYASPEFEYTGATYGWKLLK